MQHAVLVRDLPRCRWAGPHGVGKLLASHSADRAGGSVRGATLVMELLVAVAPPRWRGMRSNTNNCRVVLTSGNVTRRPTRL